MLFLLLINQLILNWKNKTNNKHIKKPHLENLNGAFIYNTSLSRHPELVSGSEIPKQVRNDITLFISFL